MKEIKVGAVMRRAGHLVRPADGRDGTARKQEVNIEIQDDEQMVWFGQDDDDRLATYRCVNGIFEKTGILPD